MKKKVLIIIGAVIIVGLAGGFIYWLKFVGTSFCYEFRDFDSRVSCQEALEIALEDTPGEIQNISIGHLSSELYQFLPLDRAEVLWLIDIKTENQGLNVLRIGIPLDEKWGIFREFIDSKYEKL